jgi:hypothetical protein
MAYEQVLPFYPKDMGKQKGWCLQNCRIGFHIYTPKYPSAKAAMDAGKKNGTYHAGTPPWNVSVPVYVSSPSKYGHVVVWDKGTWYSDGKKYNSMGGVLGWDELMDGTRVVKETTGKSFLPAKGYWCKYDVDERVGKLARFMYTTFPDYTKKKALGNIYGDYLSASIKEFQRRTGTGLYPDGMTGPLTYNKLKEYGFNG